MNQSRGNEDYGKVSGGHSMLNLRDFQSVKAAERGARLRSSGSESERVKGWAQTYGRRASKSLVWSKLSSRALANPRDAGD